MTAKETLALVGRKGYLQVPPGLSVEVVITDCREVYGRIDYAVSPVAGSGNVWVQSSRVRLITEDGK